MSSYFKYWFPLYICVTDLAPKDSFQLAQCESLLEGVQDIEIQFFGFYFCKDEEKKVGLWYRSAQCNDMQVSQYWVLNYY